MMKDDWTIEDYYYNGVHEYNEGYSVRDFVDEIKMLKKIQSVRNMVFEYAENPNKLCKERGRFEYNYSDRIEDFVKYNDIIMDVYTFRYDIEPFSNEELVQYFIEGSFLYDSEIYLKILNQHLKGLKAMDTRKNSKGSKGENLLEDILKEKKIKYKKEFSDGCINEETLYQLPFDFVLYINNEKIYVEIQGGQHFHPVEVYGGEKSYYKQIIRDKIKKDFADKNGIFVALNYKEGRIDLLKKRINEQLLPIIDKIRGVKSDKK